MSRLSSFEKGAQFEEFVINNLFTEGDYILIHRTNSYEENQARFSENSLLPDLKFRCKESGQEFYVECKFRTRFNTAQKLDVLSSSQRTRFQSISKVENTPIFFCIGYLGQPFEPENLALISLPELIHDSLFQSFLRDYEIPKQSIELSMLGFKQFKTTRKSPTRREQEKRQGKMYNHTIFKKLKNSAIGILLALIALISFNFINKTDDPVEILKEKVTNYYKVLDERNFQQLDEYIKPVTEQWYSKKDMTLKEIKEEAKKYFERFPITEVNILWNTFQVEKKEEYFFVNYNMHYTTHSTSGFSKKYFLKIHSKWNEDYQLVGISEEKLKLK